MTLQLSNVPPKPGVYIFKDIKERVLYIGKARNLRNRLRSYFYDSASLEPRKAQMVKMIKNFSYIVTSNELEALILEANLIKQYKPRFNIILRDDKNYPYIKVTITEKWPKVEVVRKIQRDGNLYFGPYVPAQSMWEALAFIRRNFLIRTCNYSLEKPMRPCVQYQMNRCAAPCAGLISRQEYMKIIDEVILFLKGNKKELLQKLQEKMYALSEDMKYEEAARIRDRILKLQQAFESQKVVAPELGDIDVIGYFRDGEDVALNVLFIRNGTLIGARDFFFKVLLSDLSEMMHSFIELFYSKEIIPPDFIEVSIMPDNVKALKLWLKKKKGMDVNIEVPSEGKKLELLHMAEENARLHLGSKKKSTADITLEVLKERLNLTKTPLSIGAFDVSTIYGNESVGAYIFWENGEFKKDYYRHLKIKGVTGVDDYAMMKEIVERILQKTGDEKMPLPDLIVVDGGKGQLEIARKVMDELSIKTDIVAIAKKPDRVILIRKGVEKDQGIEDKAQITDKDYEIISLEDKQSSSLLLKKIRDEVHRFAIGFHKKLRDKRLMESPLESIPGIGKKRRLELLRYFGSIENIRKASLEEIAKIKGFNKKIAKAVKDAFS